MAHNWWHIWGEVGNRSNRTLDTGQEKPAFNPDIPAGKIGTETIDAIGNWFNNTAYGKRFKAGQERQAALEQTLIDQGGPMSMYLKLKNQPNQLEQQILEGVSNLPNLVGQRGVDRRISDPLTYLALSGGIRGTARGVRAVAQNPRAMQGLRNINPLAPASKKVVNVKSTPIHGKPIPAETSASVLKKGSMFRKGSKSEVLAKEQSQINRALSGDPTAIVFAYSKEAGPKNTIWRVDGLADKKKFMSEVVKPWVNENKQALMTKDLKRTALGTVFYNNELYRIQGLSEHLATSGQAKLNLIRVGQDASRKYQLDPSTIQVVTDYLDKANKGFIDSKGKLGVNPEHLNAAIFRKSIKKGAGLMDKITSELGKLFKQDLDKEHAFGALSSEGFGHDDYVSQFSGDRAFNIRLRKLNAFIQSQADTLGIPGKGILPDSKKIHPRRAAMEEQYGWLQSVTNRAIQARELGDNPFTAELKDLTRQYGTLVQGSTKGVGQVPGNPLSMAEMVKLQQRGLKGDKQAAVETILAERDILNKAIEAGLAEEPDTIAILKKYLKNIDIDQQIITAKKDAVKRLKAEETYKYEGRPIGHYPKEKFKRLPRAEPKGKKQPKITESMWKALKDWELIDARSNRLWMNR